MNLLQETEEIITANGKELSEVLFVMSKSLGRPAISFSWDEFAALADFEYDDGYGGNEIESTLKVVGDNWWLERGEYDGSEWWEFKTMPECPPYQKPCKADLEE